MSRGRSEVELLRQVIETQRSIATRAHQPELVMQEVVERALDLSGADGAVVELLEGPHMVYRAVAGSAVGSEGLRLDAATSLSGRCVAAGVPLHAVDTETDPRVDLAACRRVGARSMYVAPLLLEDGRAVGVLKVMCGVPDALDEAVLGVLSAMASFIATSLQHAADFQDRDRRASVDGLTCLPNRAALLDALASALARARRSGKPVTVLFVDLDGFKAVNDRLGHDAGDRLLVAVAGALLSAVREDDTVGRLGGDEFVVVAEGVPAEEVGRLARRLEDAVSGAGRPRDGLAVGASIGAARSSAGDTAETMIARADVAMYDEKGRRRAAR